ncbi:MAG: hypothetical protein QOE64_77, partial [Frankiales bacterium]|nr:hypothetical protein [Frankiales bacterium]
MSSSGPAHFRRAGPEVLRVVTPPGVDFHRAGEFAAVSTNPRAAPAGPAAPAQPGFMAIELGRMAPVGTVVSALDVPGLVRRVRRNAGMSQRAFARLLGCGKSTVGKWETGRSIPRVPRLEQILAVSGMSLVAVDDRKEQVRPFGKGAARDKGGRHYPAHVDIRQWRPGVYWWAEHEYGVYCLPPEFVWDDMPPWVRLHGPGLVDRSRPDDERLPAQPWRRDRASFGSFVAAWRKAPGRRPPKGFNRSDALAGGYHPD